jgi:hypothetical protein
MTMACVAHHTHPRCCVKKRAVEGTIDGLDAHQTEHVALPMMSMTRVVGEAGIVVVVRHTGVRP